jgi:hypothetical protein
MDGGRVPALRKEASLSTGRDQGAELKFVVTNTLIVRDLKRSIDFYRDVLGVSLTSSLRRHAMQMSSAISSTFASPI